MTPHQRAQMIRLIVAELAALRTAAVAAGADPSDVDTELARRHEVIRMQPR